MAILHPLATVEYPSSDGLPMAESDFQRKPLTYAVEALGIYFQHRAEVYVSGNMFIYYEEGNLEAVVAPDVFVVLGTTKRDRASYMLWEEPKGPDFVLEITSRSTRTKDQGPKRGTYAFLGVREYFQYDPTHDYLVPALQGHGWSLGVTRPCSLPPCPTARSCCTVRYLDSMCVWKRARCASTILSRGRSC